jgi:hypothetical protein
MQKLLAILLIALSTKALAWRETGHYTVCEIAYRLINSKTKKAIDTIFEGQKYATHCTWPDHVRDTQKYKYSSPWHYINLDKGEVYFTKPSKKGDVLQAILIQQDYLRANRDLTLSKKFNLSNHSRKIKEALMFLGHFIGDIHQPLHVGYRSDWGGNKIQVKWQGETHANYPKIKLVSGGHISYAKNIEEINLHKVLDHHVFEKYIKDNNFDLDETGTAYLAYSDHLLGGKALGVPLLSKEIKTKWSNSTAYNWTEETIELRVHLYNVSNKEELSTNYFKKNISLLNKRLLQAGVRLSNRLDRIFDKSDQLNKNEVNLREKIKQALKVKTI